MSTVAAVDVSIVVVSYNTRELTLACLDSVARELSAHRRVRAEVLVADNASTDGSAEAIAAHPLQPRLMALQENVGFAQANNLLVPHAQGRYVLLLNPDTVVLHGAIARLLAFAESEPSAGIWGGRTLFADSSLNPSSCWARMTPWNLFCRATGLTAMFRHTTTFNGEAYGGWRRNSVRRVDIVSGCFLLTTRKLWDELGGFDPHFFMYGEDADFCLRARRIGARPTITPDATIIHLGGASDRARVAKMEKLLAAKTMLIERHWSRPLVPLGRALLATWPLTRWLALSVASLGRSEGAKAWGQIWSARGSWTRGYPRPGAAT